MTSIEMTKERYDDALLFGFIQGQSQGTLKALEILHEVYQNHKDVSGREVLGGLRDIAQALYERRKVEGKKLSTSEKILEKELKDILKHMGGKQS
jgi:hypothetical protein